MQQLRLFGQKSGSTPSFYVYMYIHIYIYIYTAYIYIYIYISKAPQSGEPATALALWLINQSGVRSPESRVRSPVQKHSCEAPGSSVALPESSGKVAEGFRRVSMRIRRDLVMILWWLCCWKSPGTSFEAGRSGSPGSRVRSPVQKHSCEAPGSSVALPESSGKVAEGFGRVLNGKYWFFIDFWGPKGGVQEAWHGGGWILGPPNTEKLNTEKPNTENWAQNTEDYLCTPHRAERGGGYIHIYIYVY